MAVDTGALYYLVDPFVQWENNNGKPIVGGHVEVFEAGTDTKVITVQDWDGTKNPFKIPLGSDGRAVILVDPGKRYDAYVYDSFNNLACSRLNIIPLSDGDISISGLSKVFHDSTLSGDGTAVSPLGVKGGGLSTVITQWPVEGNGSEEDPVTINDLTLLATDDTMTAYNAEVEGKNSIVLGVNGDWFTDATSSFQLKSDMNNYATTASLTATENSLNEKINGKLDTTAFSTVSGDFGTKTEVNAKLDTTAFSTVSSTFLTAHQSLEGYATENFVTGITNNKLDTTAFSTTSGTFLTAHQDLSEYAKKSEIPSLDGYATESFVTGITDNKLNTTAFSTVSGDFAKKNEIPTTAGLMEEDKLEYSHDEIYGNTYITGYDNKEIYPEHAVNAKHANDSKVAQGIVNSEGYVITGDDVVNVNNFEYKNDQITGYNGSAFAGNGGHEYTGDSNILVDNDSDEISLSTSVSAKEIKVYNSNGTVNDTISYGGYSLKSAPASVNAPSANYGVNGITIYGIDTNNTQSSSAINLTSGSYSANLSIKGLKGRGSNAEYYSLNPSGMKVISGQQNIYAGSDGLVFTDFVNNETIKLTSAGVQETYYDGTSTKTIALRDINQKLDTTAFDAALDVLMSEDKLEYNSQSLITGYNGSAFAGQGGGLTGDNYNLLPGANIGFAYDDTNNTVTISAAQSALSTQQLSAISSVSGIKSTVSSYSARWTNAANWTTANSATTTAVNNLVTATSAIWNNKQDELEFGYNDGKIVSINSSALSAGSNYEGVYPIEVNNDTKQISARTKAVHMQTFAHDDTLTHTEENGVYTLGVANPTNTETVLFSSDTPVSACNLTEPLTNFERVKIMFNINENCQINEFCADISDKHKNIICFGNAPDSFGWGKQNLNFESNKITVTSAWAFVGLNTNTYDANNNEYAMNSIGKIWGIIRKVNPEPGDMHIYFEDNTTHTQSSGGIKLAYDKPFDMQYIAYKFTTTLPNASDLFFSVDANHSSDSYIWARFRNKNDITYFGGIVNGGSTIINSLHPDSGKTTTYLDWWTYFSDTAAGVNDTYKMIFDTTENKVYYYKNNEYFGYATYSRDISDIKYLSFEKESAEPSVYSISVAGFISLDQATEW